jgi:hypothetical protein
LLIPSKPSAFLSLAVVNRRVGRTFLFFFDFIYAKFPAAASGIKTFLTSKTAAMSRTLLFSSKASVTGMVTTLCLVVMLLAFTRVSQTVSIKGVVLDEKATPVPFAALTIRGQKTAFQSDRSGAFSVSVASLPVTLVCNALGYEAAELTVKPHLLKDGVVNILITMKTAHTSLDEVVVVGYSASRKMDLSASVSTVSSRPFEGRASGVRITSSSSRPAKIKGTSSPVEKSVETKMGAISREKDPGSGGYKRSKLLTAGEVNDFKKWKMWEDYNEGDFKAHSARWDLYATQRYSVLLQNQNYKALIGVKVHLLSMPSGDTVWSAVSDNTGKAELWKGFGGKYESNNLVIAVEQEIRTFPAIPFAQGINKITLSRACAVSNRIEIAFVVDATGSMQDEIEYLKEELGDILTNVAAKDPSLNFHTGSVFYRDRGDAYITSVQPITGGIENTLAFIRRQSADGGGDYPEALKEALSDATQKLAWTKEARARIIFLLMDAPPHDEAKAEMAKLVKDAAAKGIRVVPVACSGTDKATEFIMRSIALATNGTYLFLTDHSGIGNPHIKPTTDEFKVELLNDILQRTIEQMCYASDCSAKTTTEPLSVFGNSEKIKVFPNPSRGPVVLETNRLLKELFVSDFTGKILFRAAVKNKPGKIRLDLSGFPSATYFIRYVTADNKTGAEKLVIAR